MKYEEVNLEVNPGVVSTGSKENVLQRVAKNIHVLRVACRADVGRYHGRLTGMGGQISSLKTREIRHSHPDRNL